MPVKIVYCDCITCPKQDCYYHYCRAPWGEPFSMKKYKIKNKECTKYKSIEGENDEIK